VKLRRFSRGFGAAGVLLAMMVDYTGVGVALIKKMI
jgi:hypothetical protein